MSTRVNPKKAPGPSGLGLPPKSERRALGKAAAARRAKAKRRRKQLRTAGAVLLALIPVALVAAAISGVFTDDKSNTGAASPSASAGASAGAGAPAAPQVSLDPALAKKPTVTKGTGDLTELKVTTLVKGTGPAVTAGQSITVNYVGVSYKTGEEFDSSWSRNEPATFGIGVGQVIQGWDQGLVGVPVGSRVQLDIPSNLAYGDDASGGRPTGPLRFVVDIISAAAQ
ncbi:FKBP-type peptidyl-prolyl cis-trans isomerase [Luedemannella helvata]|uniref:Peptidyl-prolyl cis-trans isomerase n=1 Tax=Luedemannella helvata TaxID=349315 RepID=A0ABN2KAW4_9ACTN